MKIDSSIPKTVGRDLENSIERTLRLGRKVAAELFRLAPGRDGREVESLRGCVAPLAEGSPFRDINEGDLLHVRDRLVALCAREELERRRVFRGFHDPEYGDVGGIEEVVVYSDRGRELSQLLRLIEEFLMARAVAEEIMSCI